MTAKRKKGRGVLAAAVILLLASVLLGLVWAVKRGLITTPPKPVSYKQEILESAYRYGLEPTLVAAVICTESGFDREAVSRDGAEGLMQLLPSTAEWICAKTGAEYEAGMLFEPRTNVDMGCWLLRFLLDRYGGSERYALIAYNAGHGRLEGWLNDPELLDGNGELAVIPYGETSAYVKRVELRKEQYSRIYGEELENADEAK